MSNMKRREFIKVAGAAGAATGLGLMGMPMKAAAGGGHVIVIGGGYGGTIAAKYIRMADAGIKVTLIEQNRTYHSCPFSNTVIGGLNDIGFIEHTYDGLASKHGVNIVHDTVTGIDAAKRTVTTVSGSTMSYDRLVVSPGIDFRYDTIEGYDEKASWQVPHAWKAGPQTSLLRAQLEAMPNGGTFVIATPPNPFRCPPGPYERISLVANYFKNHKPNSKIVVLDSKDKFSKQGLFTAGWTKHYGYGTDDSMITWVSKANDGTVKAVDADKRVAITEFSEHQADVLNVIPAQKAGHIAHVAGLVDDSGWCPVDHKTFESTIHPNIHVIGDASIASPLPKSGYAANSEAKVCAAAVVDLMNGRDVGTPAWVNTCYSLVTPNHGISVAMVYDYTADGKIGKVKGSGGLTPADGNNQMEAIYAQSWYANIMSDMFSGT
ncbi:MAG: FAD-dependent oxidoreductase [Gammaproteobacteria bacterium]|nr:FAD-dependent oxidoreductase [Gammaproteobacteria bacterium]MCP5135603.1 FAD-dependent oxidoreductase [Gammaproteobacteria bacterium]